MKQHMGAARVLCLGAVASVVATGLGVVTAPSAHSAGPVLPGPSSSKWQVLKKDGAVATDPTNDISIAHLNLTPAGGTLADATAFAAADLDYAYFRFHVAAQPPASGAGAFVVQFDTNGSNVGWERALRYDAAARTVTLYTGATDSGVKVDGTAGTTAGATQTGGTSYAGADGGFYVAFAVPQARLSAIGVGLGGPMVAGTTNNAGVALDASKPLLGQASADVLGTGTFGGLLGGNPAWGTLDTDPIDIDSDGDGIADKDDNCPVVANPGQEDTDEALDNKPFEPGAPDGTEGKGDACDRTPEGYDPDGDGVGALHPDKCPERPGLLSNGCVARSTTTAALRYQAKFIGIVRADYDQCVPRRGVAVFKVASGPDKLIGSGKTDANGRFVLRKRAKKGKYYLKVDPKNIYDVGVTCFGDRSPDLTVR